MFTHHTRLKFLSVLLFWNDTRVWSLSYFVEMRSNLLQNQLLSFLGGDHFSPPEQSIGSHFNSRTITALWSFPYAKTDYTVYINGIQSNWRNYFAKRLRPLVHIVTSVRRCDVSFDDFNNWHDWDFCNSKT